MKLKKKKNSWKNHNLPNKKSSLIVCRLYAAFSSSSSCSNFWYLIKRKLRLSDSDRYEHHVKIFSRYFWKEFFN